MTIVLRDFMYHDDVLMVAAGSGAGFEDESSREIWMIIFEKLDRHTPAEPGVTSEVHRAHAAAAELANDLVLANASARQRQHTIGFGSG
jgi:hypothetical protein